MIYCIFSGLTSPLLWPCIIFRCFEATFSPYTIIGCMTLPLGLPVPKYEFPSALVMFVPMVYLGWMCWSYLSGDTLPPLGIVIT